MLDAEGESPDFIIEVAGQRVGVEVVGLTDERKERTAEALAMVARRVEADLDTADLRILVDVTLNVEFGLALHGDSSTGVRPAIDVEGADRLSRTLADCVRTMAARRDEGWDEVRLAEFGLDDLYGITLWPDDKNHVSFSRTHFGLGDADVVQAAIAKKERKLDSYRARAGGSVWLLVVTGSLMSQNVVLRLLAEEHSFTSSFDKVFMLEEVLPEVRALRLIVPPQADPT
jgi:hypothetical protein